jgi:RNA polymerase sigma factor (TIGR02999 family)
MFAPGTLSGIYFVPYLITREFELKMITAWPSVVIMGKSSQDVTRLLREWGQGDANAANDLFRIVYAELRRLARRYMRHERPDHTLRTTALINEAYLRLATQNRAEWRNRTQFFAVAAQMMRRILVSYARSRAYQKREGALTNVPVDVEQNAVIAPERGPELVALDSALDRLAAFDVRKAKIVELRYFGGLEAQEIADVLGISAVTVTRDWKMAKAWLRQELNA